MSVAIAAVKVSSSLEQWTSPAWRPPVQRPSVWSQHGHVGRTCSTSMIRHVYSTLAAASLGGAAA
eukprot:6929387-Heterocapsa_arctica.AAC.1